jgi:hypothetical protein
VAAFEFAVGAGDGHALAGAHLQQVGFELGEDGEHVEEHLRHGVGGVVDAAAQRQADAPGDQSVADIAGVGDGAGEPVEFGNDQGVASAYGGQGLVESGPGAVGSGESLVEIDPVARDAERGEDLALGGEILQDGRASGVADQFSLNEPRLRQSRLQSHFMAAGNIRHCR